MSQRTAILIANSQYRDVRFSNLFAPVEEANDLKTLLSDPTVGNFDVELVVNESKSGVERALETQLCAAKPDDLVVVYFSGHGELSRNGKLYFAVSNSEAARLHSTAVSASWLRDLLDECDAASVVILLDCCYGGAYYDDRAKSTATVPIGDVLKTGDGRYVITATTSVQQAEDGRAGGSTRSVFTDVVVRGIGTGAADISGMGVITADDLGRYVRNEVPSRTTTQTPTVYGTVRQDVVLARVRNSTFRPAVSDDRDWVRLGDLLGELDLVDEMPLCAVEWRRKGLLVVPIGRAFRQGSPPGEAVGLALSGPGGHVTLVGRSGSGKSTLLRTLICAVALTHTPDEAQFYCLESGGNRLGSLRSLPHVRTVVADDDVSGVAALLLDIQETIVARKRLFQEHDLDSADALRARRHNLPHGPHPDLFLVIDRWRDFNEDLSDDFADISRKIRAIANSGLEYGVHVVLSTSKWEDLPPDFTDMARNQIQLSPSREDPAVTQTAAELGPQLHSDLPGWGMLGGVVFRAAVPSIEAEPQPDAASTRMYLDDGGSALVARLAKEWGMEGNPQQPPGHGERLAYSSNSGDLLDLLGIDSTDQIGSWHTRPDGGSDERGKSGDASVRNV